MDALAARRVVEERKRLKMTQRALAAKIGIHPARLAQLESGEAWTIANLCDAARALGCQPADLLTDAPLPRVNLSTAEIRVIEELRANRIPEAMIALGEAAKAKKEEGE